jgi:hypothetical protein
MNSVRGNERGPSTLAYASSAGELGDVEEGVWCDEDERRLRGVRKGDEWRGKVLWLWVGGGDQG